MAAATPTESRLAGAAGTDRGTVSRPVVRAVAASRAARTARTATWLAAILATGSVPLHAWMLVSHAHGPVLTVLMAATALWCWWCGVRAVLALGWPGGAPGAGGEGAGGAPLRHLWIMAQAMALVHVAMLTGFPGTGGHRHAGEPAGVVFWSGSGSQAGPGTQATLDGVAEPLLWVVVLELAVCFACAVALRAVRRGTQSVLSAAAPPTQPVCGHT